MTPITRAVNGVGIRGQRSMAACGNRERSRLIAMARTSIAPITLAIVSGTKASSSRVVRPSRCRFTIHAPVIRNGVVKCRPVHNRKAIGMGELLPGRDGGDSHQCRNGSDRRKASLDGVPAR
jgi:hypothetical protein